MVPGFRWGIGVSIYGLHMVDIGIRFIGLRARDFGAWNLVAVGLVLGIVGISFVSQASEE